jgi:hypothetical protein
MSVARNVLVALATVAVGAVAAGASAEPSQ